MHDPLLLLEGGGRGGGGLLTGGEGGSGAGDWGGGRGGGRANVEMQLADPIWLEQSCEGHEGRWMGCNGGPGGGGPVAAGEGVAQRRCLFGCMWLQARG